MSSAEIFCNDGDSRGPFVGMATTAPHVSQPDFLTVEQAAAVLGIGRTCAYKLARRAADFGEGIFPASRFGKLLLVSRRKLEVIVGGPITIPDSTTNTGPASTTSRDRPDSTTNTGPASTTSRDRPDSTTNIDHPPTITTVTTPADLSQPPLPFAE